MSNFQFQHEVGEWMRRTFEARVIYDIRERNHRHLEESLELVQALGCTKEEVLMLVDYVFSRPPGEPHQETGGVMVTLAALCNANNLDMAECADRELARCWVYQDRIRQKQLTKPRNSPLPGTG